MARESGQQHIAVLPSPSRHTLLLELDALDKLALMKEKPVTIDEAAEILGVGKQKAVEFCKQKDFPLPHDRLAGEYVLYPTLILWWRLNRQKVG